MKGEVEGLNKGIESSLNHLVNKVPDNSALERRLGALIFPETKDRIREIIVTIIVGLALGSILLVAIGESSKWVGLVVLAILAPTAALLVNDLRMFMLIILVVDIPLGLDIALAYRFDHKGGPAGLMISLMTLVLVIGYLVWLVEKPINGKSQWHTHKTITVPALIYLFALLISAFQATEVWFSITQIFLELQFLLMYIFIVNQVRTWTHIRLIFTTLAACLVFESIVILLQYFTGFNFSFFGIHTGTLGSDIANRTARLGGTLGHPNVAGTYLTASLVIIFASFLSDNGLVNKKLAFIAFLLGTIALITTQSRASWIIFAVLMPILAAQALRKRIGLKASLILCIVVVIVGAVFSSQIADRFTRDDRGSAQSRIWQSKMAFNILSDHFLTGVGLNNLWEVEPQYMPSEMIGNINVIHDKYLSIWTETGLLGLISFLWLLLAAGRLAVQTLKSTKDGYTLTAITGLLAGLIVYMVNMSAATFNDRPRLQFMWLILALIAVTSGIAKRADKLEDDPLLSKN
jgi:putative inorganic carbon (HCO3(-)) transporter